MLLKWSQKQDQQLSRIIQKYGTNDWALVRKHFKSSRSRDSVIKRWHGKLKFEKAILEPQPIKKTKKITNEIFIKKTRGQRDLRQPERQTVKKPFERNSSRSRIAQQEIKKQAENQSEEEAQSEVIQEAQVEEENSSASIQYKIQWAKSQDQRLLSLVLQDGITSWSKMATILGCSEQQVKTRWRKVIYETIKLDDKVGGFLKYSSDEDNILTIGFRNSLNWTQLKDFLPGRSEFSIQARWRRLVRPEQEVELSKNKHYIMRDFLKKIVEKKRGQHQMVEQTLETKQHFGKNA